MKILLVEDDQIIASALAHALTNQNYIVEIAADGKTGWELVQLYEYDLLLLDVMLPYLDGITFCRQLRSQGSKIPILLLTSRSSNDDKIKGLDAGADDYIVKPFNFQELLARVRAVMRRGTSNLVNVLTWGDLQIDPNQFVVTYRGKVVTVTPKEYALLELFVRNHNRVFSRKSLLDNLWNLQDTPGEETVRAHIKGLRQKLKVAGAPSDLIDTVYGLGYRLKPLTEFKQLESPSLSKFASSERSITIDKKMQAIWHICQNQFIQQIDNLLKIISELKLGEFTPEKCKFAHREAHKLSGSLGMFGLTFGSRLSKEIEQKFESLQLFTEKEHIYFTQKLTELKEHILQSSTEEPDLVINEQQLILLIDNQDEFDEKLAVEAGNRGVKMQIVANPYSAKNIIHNNHPDLILLDLSLAETPELGLKILTELTAIKPTIPVIVFTLSDSFYDRVEVAKLGGRGFLNKQMPLTHIWGMIEQVLTQKKATEYAVMIVDSDPLILIKMRKLLEPWGIKLISLQEPLQFWEKLAEIKPDLLILGVELPEVNGLEICQVVRNEPRWRKLPVLFLTSNLDEEIISQIFAAGADDYITKPLIESELVARILSKLDQVQLKRNSAEIDPLTKLLNRVKFTQKINRLLRLAKKNQESLCLFVIFLDNFSQINQDYGHNMGDKILKNFAETMTRHFQSEDLVGRWGGVEFAIAMYGMNKEEGQYRLNDLINDWQKHIFTSVKGQNFTVPLTVGMAEYPNDAKDLSKLYHVAHSSLKSAKLYL
jgi:diguanylate cyclase (GGDEF)-like protein